jgi:hypothetical protein
VSERERRGTFVRVRHGVCDTAHWRADGPTQEGPAPELETASCTSVLPAAIETVASRSTTYADNVDVVQFLQKGDLAHGREMKSIALMSHADLLDGHLSARLLVDTAVDDGIRALANLFFLHVSLHSDTMVRRDRAKNNARFPDRPRQFPFFNRARGSSARTIEKNPPFSDKITRPPAGLRSDDARFLPRGPRVDARSLRKRSVDVADEGERNKRRGR